MDAEHRPFWKRKVPWPVFLVVIGLAVAALYFGVIRPNRVPMSPSECVLGEPCNVTQQQCDKLWPGHVWDDHTCAPNLGAGSYSGY